jgi:ABC-type glutathione transport system ATPase component
MPIADSAGPLLTVRDLHKSYFRASRRFRRRNEIEAVKGVSLELRKGSTLAIVGSSGGGKSTLARSIAGLEKPSGGEAWFDGRKVERAGESRIQLIFQDPGASINPKFTVVRALAEPLSVRPEAEPRTYAQRLEQVGLSSSILGRLTGQLSGGQKARLAVARALAACGRLDEPSMLILDESLSSLDLSVQAQIVNLLWISKRSTV